MSRKRTSEEFKQTAVQRVRSGESVAQVARETGVSGRSIRQWVQAAEAKARERPATAAELAEIRRLKRELKKVKEHVVILKKATALFAQDPQ